MTIGSVRDVMRLPRGATRTAFLEPFDHAFELGIAGAKAARKPVSPALGYFLAIGEDLELTGVSRLSGSLNTEALLDEGHETRDLGVIVVSCRAMNDLDLHLFSNTLRTILMGPPIASPRFIFLLSLFCKPA
jgi:hypothetical protein